MPSPHGAAGNAARRVDVSSPTDRRVFLCVGSLAWQETHNII